MRGERLINSLFPEKGAVVKPLPAAKPRGRSDVLIRQRNERLCARVYYLRTYKKLRNEDIIQQITTEFDISAATIPQILQEDEWQAHLLLLKDLKPKRSWFKERWGWIVW